MILNNMKANELMIGDWVHLKAHRGFEAQDIQVATIPDGSSEKHYGHIGAWVKSEDNDFRDIEDTRLEPIPLTSEFLEKNGFRRNFDSVEKRYTYISNFFPLIIIEEKKKWWFGTYDTAMELLYILQIKYVHQFQQALRIGGVIKEIVL